jgi:DnaJ like chaperone protein
LKLPVVCIKNPTFKTLCLKDRESLSVPILSSFPCWAWKRIWEQEKSGDFLMGWMGKIVGGTIGFAMGGPLGAVAGAIFGHAYDKGSELEYQGLNRPRLSDEEEIQMTFFVAVFSMLAKLVRADGNITKEEIDSIEKIMAQDLNLHLQSRQVAVNIFNAALHSPQSFEDYATHFYSRFHFKPQLLEFMLDLLFKVSTVHGSLKKSEEDLLISAAKIFQFSDQRYLNIKYRYVRAVDQSYAVLGCSPHDSDDMIKSSYRKLVREFHPDAIAAKGLPEEFTAFAQEKFRKIQEAYENIKKERGIR